MDINRLKKYIASKWDNSIIPILEEYIKIPNKSPAFDPNWEKNGYMEEVLNLSLEWINQNNNGHFNVEVKRIKGKTPLILAQYNGQNYENILMYGHLDKQPEMTGWDKDLSPWKPVIKNDKLYGRGGADDGYAVFASICAINALIEQNIPLPNISIIIEFSEESGSPDLPFYLDKLNDLPSPDLVICLDSGAGNYEQFWMTTSLRGMIGATLKVNVLTEGIHSGGGSGIVPSSFRIIREILDRVENSITGEILIDDLFVEIPQFQKDNIEKFVDTLQDEVFSSYPWYENTNPSTEDKIEAVKRRTWKPTLSIVGMNGIPEIKDAGNVLRPNTEVKLSFRLPPLVDSILAQKKLEKILIENPPYNATVSVEFEEPADGWSAPNLSENLKDVVNKASLEFYNKPAVSMGEGGTIPFMAMLGEKYPNAQFVITGVLGPNSNAHGPNEFLHIPYVKKLNCCISYIISNFRK